MIEKNGERESGKSVLVVRRDYDNDKSECDLGSKWLTSKLQSGILAIHLIDSYLLKLRNLNINL